MDEYANKFLELLRYVRYIRDEKVKFQHFLSGLPKSYKDRIEFYEPRTLEEEIHLRKFQLKRGLLTQIQIPCHHVLANEITLNLKYRIGLKQVFNINLGIGIIKKLLFLFVFSTYIPMFLLKF